MLALDGLPFGDLLRDDLQTDVLAAPLFRSACVRLDDRWLQVIDDARDHVRILDGGGNAMAVIDEEAKTCDHEEPARDERDLRNKSRVSVLMGHQEDQTQVDESGHEEANGGLRDPILKESIEQAWTEQRGHHREHEKRDREDQRQDRADAAEHRAQDRAGVVDATHGEPLGDVNDAASIQHVRDHGEPEQDEARQGEFQRNPPEIYVRGATDRARTHEGASAGLHIRDQDVEALQPGARAGRGSSRGAACTRAAGSCRRR